MEVKLAKPKKPRVGGRREVYVGSRSSLLDALEENSQFTELLASLSEEQKKALELVSPRMYGMWLNIRLPPTEEEKQKLQVYEQQLLIWRRAQAVIEKAQQDALQTLRDQGLDVVLAPQKRGRKANAPDPDWQEDT